MAKRKTVLTKELALELIEEAVSKLDYVAVHCADSELAHICDHLAELICNDTCDFY